MANESACTNGVNLDWAVGCQLALKTTLGEEVSGTLFSFDRITNCLVLTNPGAHPGTVSYMFLKANYVKEICSAVAASEPTTKSLGYIDLDESCNREERAVRALAMEEAPSVGDIEAGQKMMTKLSKKWSCRWEGRKIVIEDQVTLVPPYSNDSFQATPEFAGLLEEIKESTMEVTPRPALSEDG